MEQIVKKWDELGLLKLAKNPAHKTELALLLENQRIFNQFKQNALVNKLTIPIVVRVFSKFAGFDLASVQTLNSPVGKFQHRDQMNVLRSTEITAHSRFLHALVEKDLFETHTGRNLENLEELQQQAKVIEDISEAILFELNSEVLNDLKQVAGTTVSHQWKTPQNLLDSIIITSASISKKIGKHATWAVVPKDLGQELSYLVQDWQPSKEKPSETNLYKAGTVAKKIDVYIDPMAMDYGVLLGHKGDAYQSGYFYCPYLPLEVIEDRYFKVRHGKKLLSNDFYAQIFVENYFPTTEDQRRGPPFIEQFEPDFPGAEEFIKFGDDSAFLLDEEL